MYVLRLPVVATLLALSLTTSKAEVGKITEQTGPTEIQRLREVIPGSLTVGLEMKDAIVTANARAGITFRDNTRVQMTEQSKLIIDTFVYDPAASDAGKLSMKAAFGTVKYASGQIARSNPQEVKIETPTASIGVRGTDFTMTVDELGRSLIILLPSCPTGFRSVERDCVTGKIIVTTDMGEEILDRPFQSTVTTSREKNPSKSVILKLDPSDISNMLILTPPKVEEQQTKVMQKQVKTALDINYLDQNFLDTSGMLDNMLAYTVLDVNRLNTNFLFNMLDLLNQILLDNALDEFSKTGNMLPNYTKINKVLGLQYAVDGDTLMLYKESPISDYVELRFNKYRDGTLNLTQNSIALTQKINRGSSTNITIKQGQ